MTAPSKEETMAICLRINLKISGKSARKSVQAKRKELIQDIRISLDIKRSLDTNGQRDAPSQSSVNNHTSQHGEASDHTDESTGIDGSISDGTVPQISSQTDIVRSSPQNAFSIPELSIAEHDAKPIFRAEVPCNYESKSNLDLEPRLLGVPDLETVGSPESDSDTDADSMQKPANKAFIEGPCSVAIDVQDDQDNCTGGQNGTCSTMPAGTPLLAASLGYSGKQAAITDVPQDLSIAAEEIKVVDGPDGFPIFITPFDSHTAVDVRGTSTGGGTPFASSTLSLGLPNGETAQHDARGVTSGIGNFEGIGEEDSLPETISSLNLEEDVHVYDWARSREVCENNIEETFNSNDAYKPVEAEIPPESTNDAYIEEWLSKIYVGANSDAEHCTRHGGLLDTTRGQISEHKQATPPGLHVDQDTRDNNLESCFDLLDSNANDTGPSSKLSASDDRNGVDSRIEPPIESSPDSRHEAADSGKLQPEAATPGGIQQLVDNCKRREEELAQQKAEYEELKTHLRKQEVAYIASEQAMQIAGRENLLLREKLSKATSDAVYYHQELDNLHYSLEAKEGCKMPDSYQNQNLIDRLRDELKAQATAHSASMQTAKETQAKQAKALMQRDSEIKHHKQVIAIRDRQLESIMEQWELDDERREKMFGDLVIAYSHEQARDQILLVIEEQRKEIGECRQLVKETAVANYKTEKDLLYERRRLQLFYEDLEAARQHETELESELREADSEIHRLKFEVEAVEGEKEEQKKSHKAELGNRENQVAELQGKLDDLNAQDHAGRMDMHKADREATISVLKYMLEIHQEQLREAKEELWEAQRKLYYLEACIFDGEDIARIRYEPEVEVWRRRAERAEAACEVLDPNPLSDPDFWGRPSEEYD